MLKPPNPPLEPITKQWYFIVTLLRTAQRHNVRPPEVMTGVTDRAAAPDRKIIYIVNTHGWHVMKIMPKSQDPGSAFTIGLSRMFETVALS